MDGNADIENEKAKNDSSNLKQFAFHKTSTGSQKASTKSSFNQNDHKPVEAKKSSKDSNHIGKYRLVSTLGRGNFAKVKLATHVTTGLEVAVKVIDKTQLNSVSMKKLFREVDIMKTLNHPNIVKLYEVIESERHVYLVMEYVPKGELFDHLVNNGRMKEKFAREKFRQILSAIQYCHQKKIVHRDLKAENVLVDRETNMKIADFGFANHFGVSGKLDTFCGSPPYAAPELFQGKRYEGPEVDIWSLGVILYTIVSGSLPFDAQNLKELREKVLRGKYRVPYYLTAECEHLLKKMLILNPEKRHSLLSIMSDKWINMGYENDPLKPYIEPQINYNDPIKLNIMLEMGFSSPDIQDTFSHKKFNNIHATYVLLEGFKALKDLPQASINVQSASNSNSSANDAKKSDSTPPNTSAHKPVQGQTSSGTKGSDFNGTKVSVNGESKDKSVNGNERNGDKELLNGNSSNIEEQTAFSGPGDNKSEEAKKKIGTASWMKPSVSAGPATTTTISKKNSDNQKCSNPTLSAEDVDTLNDGVKSVHRPEIGKPSVDRTLSPNCNLNPASSTGIESWVRRNNTFSTSDKTRINDNPLHRVTPQLCINKTTEGNFDDVEIYPSTYDQNSESDQANEALLSNSAKPTAIKTKPATEYNPMLIQKLMRSFSRKSKSTAEKTKKSNFNRKDPNRATAPLHLNGSFTSAESAKAKDDTTIPNSLKNTLVDPKLSHWDGGEINPDMTMISLAHPEDVTVDSSEDANSFQYDKSSTNMEESVLAAYNKSHKNDESLLISSISPGHKNSISLMDDEVCTDEKKIGKAIQIELRAEDQENDATLKKSNTTSSTTATNSITSKSVENNINSLGNGLDKKSVITTSRNTPNNKSFRRFLLCMKSRRKIPPSNHSCQEQETEGEIGDNPWTPMTNSTMHSETVSRDDHHASNGRKKANTIDDGRYTSNSRRPPSHNKYNPRGTNFQDLLGCIRVSRNPQHNPSGASRRPRNAKVDENTESNEDDFVDDKEQLMAGSPQKSSGLLHGRTLRKNATNLNLPPYSLGNYFHSQIKTNNVEELKRAIAFELDAFNISYSTSEFEFTCHMTEQKSANQTPVPGGNKNSSTGSRSHFQVCLCRGLLQSKYGARIKYMSGDQASYQLIKQKLCSNINNKLHEF